MGLLRWSIPALALYAALALAGPADGEPAAAAQLAPGWGPLGYAAPQPGSYALPVIGPASDGAVLDEHGRVRRLHDLYDGRLTLLSFIYRSCDDVNGCPLANAVLGEVRQRMRDDPALDQQLRLLSLSFDPRDGPGAEHAHGAQHQDDPDWLQLSGVSRAQLAPLLAAYGQSVTEEIDAEGHATGRYAHLLKVFLIDRAQRIRNIYSADFLHADLLLADIRTLLGEERVATNGGLTGGSPMEAADDRGDLATLLARLRQPPLGLPPLAGAERITPAQLALGRKLFFDRRLSLNNTLSCAMCHVPEQGFTQNELATPVGFEGRTVRRNAPTLLNVAHASRLFHDAREYALEQQVWGPLLATNEMANPSVGAVIETLRRLPDYADRFEQAYGQGPGMETVGRALAAFQRSLLAADSPFDRWHFGGDPAALSAAAQRGFALFVGKAGCAGCHRLEAHWALFADGQMHNTGVGYCATMQTRSGLRPVELAPGVVLTLDTTVIDAQAAAPPSDLGRYEVTQDPADRWKYRTPSLRNVALTAPYMHDGSLATLADVIDFYDRGGIANPLLSPLLRPLGLDAGQKQDLEAFLRALTGAGVDALVTAARAAPIGDTRGEANVAADAPGADSTRP